MKNVLLPAIVTVTLLACGGNAFAQGPDGPPPGDRPPFPGGPDGPPPFGEGGPGRFGGPRPITAATLPVDALTHYLKLSALQQKQLTAIVQELRTTMPRPPAPPQPDEEDSQPPRPSRQEMETRRKKMQAAESKASKEIIAVLTPAQKIKLPQLLKAFSALQADHIALSAASRLNLSASQIKRLAAAGISATHEVVVSDFTAAQNNIADANRRDGGRPPFGGPGEGPPPDRPEGGPYSPPPGAPSE